VQTGPESKAVIGRVLPAGEGGAGKRTLFGVERILRGSIRPR
jgi:hypothetical protein